MADKMLVIHLEDEGALKAIIYQLTTYLEKDVELKQFSTGTEVVEFLEEPKDVAAFMLDVRVPGEINGLEVAEHVRTQGYTCPIFIVSAYDSPEKAWLSKWDCQWTPKPTHASDLRRIILPSVRAYVSHKNNHPDGT